VAGPLRVERDVEVARWVQQSLADFGSVATNVPPIFDAYARVLHPATLETPALRADGTGETDAWGNVRYDAREITWAEAGRLLGDRDLSGDRYTVWESRFGDGDAELADGRRILPPHGLDTPVPLLATLIELLLECHGDAEVLAAVWAGSGLDPRGSSVFTAFPEGTSWWVRRRESRRLQAQHRAEQVAAVDPEVLAAMQAQHVLGLPAEQQGRGHVLLRAQLGVFADPAWVETAGLGWRADRPLGYRAPNAIWPVEPHAAPAWFIATDLDLDVTLIGGSAQLVDRVLDHPAIEAERIRPTDPVL
jgi:hypothetical protein